MPERWSPGVKEKLQAGPTRWIRGAHGETVHLWGCPHAGRWWVAWKWAEGRSWDEIARLDWVKPCKRCRPEQNTGKSPPFPHPETGELLSTREQFLAALAEMEEKMAPFYRARHKLREEAAERFEAAERPSRRRDRTDKQEKVERCPRCGGRLESEGPPG